MNEIPKTTRDALATTATALLAPLGFPKATIDGALTALLSELSGTGMRSITSQTPCDRVLTAAQVAALLARSKKTVCELAKRGKIRRVCLGAGGIRTSGYSEASVRAFLSGKDAA